MNIYFYRNKNTGDVYYSILEDKGGEDVELLRANTTDAATEKHVPVVTIDGKSVKVKVGEVAHPMTLEHHISFIVLVTDQKVEMKNLDPTSAPEAEFTLADEERVQEVYEYCNLHGLWVKKVA